jgi:hypothetical protein
MLRRHQPRRELLVDVQVGRGGIRHRRPSSFGDPAGRQPPS